MVVIGCRCCVSVAFTGSFFCKLLHNQDKKGGGEGEGVFVVLQRAAVFVCGRCGTLSYTSCVLRCRQLLRNPWSPHAFKNDGTHSRSRRSTNYT